MHSAHRLTAGHADHHRVTRHPRPSRIPHTHAPTRRHRPDHHTPKATSMSYLELTRLSSHSPRPHAPAVAPTHASPSSGRSSAPVAPTTDSSYMHTYAHTHKLSEVIGAHLQDGRLPHRQPHNHHVWWSWSHVSHPPSQPPTECRSPPAAQPHSITVQHGGARLVGHRAVHMFRWRNAASS